MRHALLVMFLLAGTARADDINDGVTTLVKAIPKRNVKLLAPFAPIYVADIAWRSDACTTQFGGKQIVQEAALPALLDCLAALEIKAQLMGATYEPGTVMMVAIDTDNHLRIDGTMAGIPLAPLVRADALPARLQSHDDVKPDDETRAALAKTKGAVAHAAGIVCVDPTGAIESVLLDHVSPAFPSFGRTVAKAVAAWKVPPFKVKGKGVRACVPFSKQTPAKLAHVDEPVARDSLGVMSELPIEDLRLSGVPNIAPDTTTRVAVNKRKIDANGVWYVCLDASGGVSSVAQGASTGYGVWDSAVRAAIAKWKFKPVDVGTTHFCARYALSFQGA